MRSWETSPTEVLQGRGGEFRSSFYTSRGYYIICETKIFPSTNAVIPKVQIKTHGRFNINYKSMVRKDLINVLFISVLFFD